MVWPKHIKTTRHLVLKYHSCTGKVFRVSPNELSFASGASYKSIYGPSTKGQVFHKSEFYAIFGAGFESGCIGSERDPATHARMKRLLAPAFSNSALLKQESVIQRCVDEFVDRMYTAGGTTEKGLNMTDWYEMLAFDILGEMAFGESFDCVKTGTPHYWQQLIAKHLFWINAIDNLRNFAVIRLMARLILPFLTLSQNDHSKYSRMKMNKSVCSISSSARHLT